MPRLKNRPPKYRLHKATGQAVVTLSGQDHYLGVHGSAASRDKYESLLGDWLTRGKVNERDAVAGATINMVLISYWQHAKDFYASDASDGHVACIRLMMRPLKRLFGDTPAADFGPLRLQTLRDEYVRMGWSRSFINAQVTRLRGMFKWAAGRELVATEVWAALKMVDGLRKGKTPARENEKVRPVEVPVVLETLKHTSRTIGAMIRVEMITGARPGEIVSMRPCDIDRSCSPWMYRPEKHKTEHHDIDRVIPLGPRAQAIITPFLPADPSAHVFSPARAMAELREHRRAARKTPLSCGNKAGSNVRSNPIRVFGDAYDVSGYRNAIVKACEKAFPPPPHLHRLMVQGGRGKHCRRWETAAEWKARIGPARWAELQAWQSSHAWHPNQLRHTRATELRKQYGLEAAQVILGHRTLRVTELYAEKNVEAAKQIMADVG